jgi:hypothetical protein
LPWSLTTRRCQTASAAGSAATAALAPATASTEAGGGEVFFVEGDLNPADGPSRDPTAPLGMKIALEEGVTFPSLESFCHAYDLIPRLERYV